MAPDTYLYNPTFYSLAFVTTAIWIPKHTEAVALPLILLLSLKMILQGSKLWNKSLAASINMAIYTLLLTYGVLVFFKVAGIVAQNNTIST